MRRISALLAVGLLLTGCNRPASQAADSPIDARNPLEVAARQRGVVQAEASDPTGVFERRHELGRDAMCVVPDGAGQWRFALAAAFGSALSCRAEGRIAREGDGWRFTFAGVQDCSVLLHEEEDELRLPGMLPTQCDSLCAGRVSLAGLRLPRASWSAADAKSLRMRDEAGNMVRPCGG
ncbi:hypothetical protein [Sphingopyxis panaciterrulae]|uniref:Putative hemolysin n=1 Tax=Sphingopyxis panaciterrulae TaxID=462372 RepID=A0A7W9B4E7_9SPHN|nr:hypothetical protein [Sphingopyxis panaciterrulae]MBB5706089.1 putative hemolysin [Sphingopyxis panaciterrulae]